MRTVETKVYEFEELSEQVQERVIGDFNDINVDYDWWDIDGLLDLTKEEMKKKGIAPGEIKDVLFSYKISAFDFDRGQYIQFDNVVVNNDDVFRRFLEIPEDLWDQCAYAFTDHARFVNTCLELQIVETPTEKEEKILDRAVEIMADKIHEAWVSLRNDYEYFTSEEAVRDTILANEYEFYEDGKMFYMKTVNCFKG